MPDVSAHVPFLGSDYRRTHLSWSGVSASGSSHHCCKAFSGVCCAEIFPPALLSVRVEKRMEAFWDTHQNNLQ